MTEIKIISMNNKRKTLYGRMRTKRKKYFDTACRYIEGCHGDITYRDCTGCRPI